MSEPIKRDYIFYKFVHNCNDITDFCYVGSTSNETKRKQKHKTDCNNPDSKNYNYDVYKIMRANGGFSNFKMVTIGTATQLTKKEANKTEEQYRVSERANMNMIRCFTTPEQKLEYGREYSKKYRANNADKIKQQKKDYKIKNRDKITQYERDRCAKKKLRNQSTGDLN